MPVLHAEIQVAGVQSACTKVAYSLRQGVDYEGRPNTVVNAELLKYTFTGEEALNSKWVELAFDSYRRESGHYASFDEEGRTFRQLTFYDAYCVHYELRFDARGQNNKPSLETEIHFSAAAVDFDGVHVENHSRLWWEKNHDTRFNALIKPAQLLPSLKLKAKLTSQITTTLPQKVVLPIDNTPSTTSKDKRKKLLGAKPSKGKSKRRQYLGKTPSKSSATGRKVQERMETEGKLRINPDNNIKEILGPDGNWYATKDTDMGHLHDAVSWWNTTGRYHGIRSPEVRTWMLDSNNYELEPSSINQSRGAKLKENYLPPIKQI